MGEKWDSIEWDNLIQQQMKLWRVPGAAVGIVENGEVVYTGAFGWRDIDKKLPVTTDTVFPIGSTTKAFTSTAIGMLVDEGKLDIDTPIIQYMPEFKMFYDDVTKHVTARDMMCHRTGLPLHEYMWFNAPFSREEIVRRIRYLKPSWPFRGKWHYNNHMYAALGCLIEKLSGMTWEEFIQKRILAPLDMRSSSVSLQQMLQGENFSLPYEQEKNVFGIPYRNIDAIGPAGSINSNLTDMLTWLKFQMSGGLFGQTQLVSKAYLEQTHKQQIPCRPYAWSFPEMQAPSYGMGWFIDIFRGMKMVSHAGNIDGFSALVGFLPERNVGVVLLTNMNNTFMIHGLMYQMFDHALGYKDINWCQRMKHEVDHFFCMLRGMKEKVLGVQDIELSDKKKQEYMGTYENPGYGKLEITQQNGELRLIFNEINYELYATGEDLFGFSFDLMQIAFAARAKRNPQSKVTEIVIQFDRFVEDIVFNRIYTESDTVNK